MIRRALPLAALVVACGGFLVWSGADRRTWSMLLIVPALLAAARLAERDRRVHAALLPVAALLAAGLGLRLLGTVRTRLRVIPEWDFLGFWLHARSAVLGLDFYDPANAGRLAQGLPVSAEFRSEIIDVGFWYPPPSMFLFLPLGWLEQRPALAFWYLLQFAFLALATRLLKELAFPRLGAAGVAVSAALVVLSYGTISTVAFAQTTFAALALTLLFWRSRDSPFGAVFLTAAVFVKPVLIVLAVPLLLRAKWRSLFTLAASAAGAVVAAFFAFGPTTSLHYFSGADTGTKPSWIYAEPTNQSLLGLVLRATHARCADAHCLAEPKTLVLLSLFGAATLGLSVQRRHADLEKLLSLWLAFGLLAYPVSQVFYSILLLPPLLVSCRAGWLGTSSWLRDALVTFAFVLFSAASGVYSTWGYLLVWGILMLSLLRNPEPA